MAKVLEVHDGIELGPNETAEELRDTLARLALAPGVSLTMLVDREGFLIESAGDARLAPEMAGALASCLADSSDSVGRELGHGALQSVLLEYDSGAILVNAAGPATILATVVCDPAAVTRVRHEVKRALPDLANGI